MLGQPQELHEDLLHEPHPGEDVCFSTPLTPKADIFLTTSGLPHAGQSTVLLPKTRSSNSWPQPAHRYS